MTTDTGTAFPGPRSNYTGGIQAGTQSDGRGTPVAERTKRTPQAHRWAGDLADDIDPIMVERLMAGLHPDGYTAWERREAVRRLRLAGLYHRQIAIRLGINERQVLRDLERFGLSRVGWQRAQWTAAAHRRPIAARLYRAGLRTVEVATMLGVAHGVAWRDRERLGIASAGFNPTAGRSRGELLAAYGHLLNDDCQESA